MSWNYRVCRHYSTLPDGTVEDYYRIHEVYYDKRGKITAVSVDGIDPHGLTLTGLKKDLSMMRAALKQPVLEFDNEIVDPLSPT